MACGRTACRCRLRSNTFVDALRAGGYATALVGKSHLQNFTGFGPMQKRAPPRDGRPRARCGICGSEKADRRRRPLRSGAAKPLVIGPRFCDAAAVLRFRACRSVHRSRPSGRRPLLCLAEIAAARRRRAARSKKSAAARLRLPAGDPDADSGGALSDELHRRQSLRMARRLRARQSGARRSF